MKRRAWFRVHSFTGVITGLLLFLICWSGTFATVSNEIDWLVTPEMRVSGKAERASWGELLHAVEAELPVTAVHFMSAPLYSRSAAEVLIDLPEQRFVTVYLDPWTAEVLGTHSAVDVQRFFRDLHRRLFIPGAVGVVFVALFGLTMVVSMVAALFFYKRWWKRFFEFRVRRGPAMWSHLHRLAGLWNLWFVLVIGVTGLWYGLEALHVVPYPPAPSPPESAANPGPSLQLDELMAQVRAVRPDLEVRRIIPPGASFGDALIAEGQAEHVLVRDRINHVVVHAADGTVLAQRSGSDAGLYERWVHTADPLHFGDFGGLVSKLIWFVFGLLLSGLALTGTYLHARRLAREAGGDARARWPGTLAAIVISLFVVVAMVPLGLVRLHLAGPIVDGVRELPSLAPGVSAVLVSWSVLTLLIIALWVFALWRPQLVGGSLRPARNTRQ